MEYRTLGRTGVKVAPLCLGTGNFVEVTPEAECIQILHRALDAGLNFIDTGDTYGDGEAERIIGRVLQARGQRQDVILGTKVFFPTGDGPNDRGTSRLHVMRACEDSLRRLGTEYIDLYQIHRPSFDVPVDETLGALTDLVQQGKVRYVGCSTHPAWKVMEALMVSELKGFARYVSEQSPYNLLDRRIENELVPLCTSYGLGILAWAPMAMGILAGRYSDASTFPSDSQAGVRGGIYAERVSTRGIEVGKQFIELAREAGIPPAQLAMLWTKDQPGITATIYGASTVGRLEEILPILDMHLDDSLRRRCDEIVPPGSAVANFYNTSGWMRMQILWAMGDTGPL